MTSRHDHLTFVNVICGSSFQLPPEKETNKLRRCAECVADVFRCIEEKCRKTSKAASKLTTTFAHVYSAKNKDVLDAMVELWHTADWHHTGTFLLEGADMQRSLVDSDLVFAKAPLESLDRWRQTSKDCEWWIVSYDKWKPSSSSLAMHHMGMSRSKAAVFLLRRAAEVRTVRSTTKSWRLIMILKRMAKVMDDTNRKHLAVRKWATWCAARHVERMNRELLVCKKHLHAWKKETVCMKEMRFSFMLISLGGDEEFDKLAKSWSANSTEPDNIGTFRTLIRSFTGWKSLYLGEKVTASRAGISVAEEFWKAKAEMYREKMESYKRTDLKMRLRHRIAYRKRAEGR